MNFDNQKVYGGMSKPVNELVNYPSKLKKIEEAKEKLHSIINFWFRFDENVAEELTDLATGKFLSFKISQNNGYVIAPQKLYRCLRLTELEKLLLLDLLSLSGGKKRAYPGHKTLAFNFGKKSTTSIKETLDSLREKLFINWESCSSHFQTNNYYILQLYKNPYIIMSEIVHFIRNTIIEKCKGKVSTEKVSNAILEFVELPKDKLFTEIDLFGESIKFLQSNPGIMFTGRMWTMIDDFCELVTIYIERRIKCNIDVDWCHILFDEAEKRGEVIEAGEHAWDTTK